MAIRDETTRLSLRPGETANPQRANRFSGAQSNVAVRDNEASRGGSATKNGLFNTAILLPLLKFKFDKNDLLVVYGRGIQGHGAANVGQLL